MATDGADAKAVVQRFRLDGGVLITGGGNTVQANANNGGFTGSYPQQ